MSGARYRRALNRRRAFAPPRHWPITPGMANTETTKTETAESKTPANALSDIAAALGGEQRGLPPVHLWDPPFCGDLNMRIAADGLWFYEGTPIGRERLVRLFSTVLKREDDKFFLVTPVEKVGITVEDAPFIAVAMEVEGEGPDQRIHFSTNVGDIVTVDAEHPFRFAPAPEPAGEKGEVTPYVMVRAGLEAKLRRPVFYELVEHGVDAPGPDDEMAFGVWSSGVFFPIVPSALLADAR